jgi:hypothetical protein
MMSVESDRTVTIRDRAVMSTSFSAYSKAVRKGPTPSKIVVGMATMAQSWLYKQEVVRERAEELL